MKMVNVLNQNLFHTAKFIRLEMKNNVLNVIKIFIMIKTLIPVI